MNEPGSLNFNVLNTRDPAAAKRFYGALFGWTTLDLGSGEFWTLSAYGDHLEQRTPGTRERTAQLGAAGFEDVVAAITPIARDDADTPAHWSVTFSTEDADAPRRHRPSPDIFPRRPSHTVLPDCRTSPSGGRRASGASRNRPSTPG